VTLARIVLIVALLVPGVASAQDSRSPVVLMTQHFAFYSDLANNVNDALAAASGARRAKQPELFASGPEKTCLDGLPSADRERWERAVAYYTDSKATGFQIVLLRFKLAGLQQRFGMDDKANLQYLDEIAAVREGAPRPHISRAGGPRRTR
jgi:hypothetical protein